MAPRRNYPNITQGTDGQWHAWLTVGTKPNRRPDQRHIKRKTQQEVQDRVDELLEQRRAGAVVRPGRAMTVEQWMEHYLKTEAPTRCDPGTIRDYRSACRHWVYPVAGKTRIDRLARGQLQEIYLRMRRAGRAASMILKVHRILTRALEIAYREGLTARNVAKLIDSPSASPVEQQPLSIEEASAVLVAAAARRNPARWSVALGLGLRQGEVLGLRWEYFDLEKREMRVWWQLRRRAFEHGCEPFCGRKRGGNCPDRTLEILPGEVLLENGLILKEPKGTGRRVVPIPEEICEELEAHRAGQAVERILAGEVWVDHDLVFTEIDGTPVHPDHDYAAWKEILQDAGVDHSRLHDARHTAGTVLLALGADLTTVQEILGHSDIRTTRGYVHVASEIARAATERMGSALFKKPVTP